MHDLWWDDQGRCNRLVLGGPTRDGTMPLDAAVREIVPWPSTQDPTLSLPIRFADDGYRTNLLFRPVNSQYDAALFELTKKLCTAQPSVKHGDCDWQLAVCCLANIPTRERNTHASSKVYV